MRDWKQVLREIKKVLPKTTHENNKAPTSTSSHNRPADQKPTPVGKDRGYGAIFAGAKNTAPARPRVPDLRNPQESRINRQAQGGNQATQAQQIVGRPKPLRPVGVPERFGETRSSALTRQNFFKKPEPWVTEGARLHYASTPQGTAVEIVIGLDFGTSYTKAAVGLKDQIIPVSWEGVSLFADSYLLPTEYSELKNGECHIGQASADELERVHHRLKHAFIDPAVSSGSIAKGAVFVGLVLRYIRAWVFKVHGKKIGNSPIRWLFNIGAPSNGLENPRLETAYRKLAGAAWKCSQLPGNICMADAVSAAESTDPKAIPEGLLDLTVKPEFVGQIAGYVKSPQRKPGLHALVDVGGGTLDVVTFIVHEKDGEDVFPFLVPRVKPLGTQMLNYNRFVSADPNGVVEFDELQPVLDPSEFVSHSGLSSSHVQDRDKVFWETVAQVVHGVFWETKQRRDPKSQHWWHGLPVFLTGGGATVEGYVGTTKSAGERVAKSLNIISLPHHPALADFSGGPDNYQRISVACGLAMDAMNLGQIRPAKDIEDFSVTNLPIRPRLDYSDLYT